MWPSLRFIAVCALVPLFACGGPSAQTDRPDPPSSPADLEAPDGVQLRLTFDRPPPDAGKRVFDAGAGWPEAVVIESQPGVLQSVPGEAGFHRAVRFPPSCAAAACPRAMIEMADDDRLDPGSSDFEFGARVLVAENQTSAGSNIVQKGRFDTTGGQWKLQVDGQEGRPSCVLQGGDGGERETVRLVAGVGIADNGWHQVSCALVSGELTITVDDSTKTIDAQVGDVSNAAGMRIGASGPAPTDDQFHGAVDEVHFCVPACG